MGRDDNREGPLEAVFEVPGALAQAHQLGPHRDVAFLPRPVIVAQQPPVALAAADRPAEDDVGIVRPHRDVATLAAARLVPLSLGDGAAYREAGDAEGRVVLLRAVDAVGHLRIGGDVVELGRGLVVEGGPRGTAVEGDAGAAVVALDHAPRVARVDPQVMVIAVRRGHRRKGAAAVGRLPALQVEHPDGVGILRVGVEVHVIPGAPPQLAVFAEPLPRLAAVIRAEQRAVLGLDQRPDAVRFGGRDGHADLALDRCR